MGEKNRITYFYQFEPVRGEHEEGTSNTNSTLSSWKGQMGTGLKNKTMIVYEIFE